MAVSGEDDPNRAWVGQLQEEGSAFQSGEAADRERPSASTLYAGWQKQVETGDFLSRVNGVDARRTGNVNVC